MGNQSEPDDDGPLDFSMKKTTTREDYPIRPNPERSSKENIEQNLNNNSGTNAQYNGFTGTKEYLPPKICEHKCKRPFLSAFPDSCPKGNPMASPHRSSPSMSEEFHPLMSPVWGYPSWVELQNMLSSNPFLQRSNLMLASPDGQGCLKKVVSPTLNRRSFPDKRNGVSSPNTSSSPPSFSRSLTPMPNGPSSPNMNTFSSLPWNFNAMTRMSNGHSSPNMNASSSPLLYVNTTTPMRNSSPNMNTSSSPPLHLNSMAPMPNSSPNMDSSPTECNDRSSGGRSAKKDCMRSALDVEAQIWRNGAIKCSQPPERLPRPSLLAIAKSSPSPDSGGVYPDDSEQEGLADSSVGPLPKRKKATPVPESKKDPLYKQRRDKNNAAAKKSREKRRENEMKNKKLAEMYKLDNERLRMALNTTMEESARCINEMTRLKHALESEKLRRELAEQRVRDISRIANKSNGDHAV